jgi:hypothetical protein
MNLTVGPLPPAVYWRRRAIVLGGLLLVVLLLVYACSGSGQPTDSAHHTAAGSPSPSTTDGLFPIGDDPSAPSSAPSQPVLSPTPSPTQTPSATPTSTAPAGDTCTDSQIKVTPVISSTSPTTSRLVHGGTFDIKLKVRNVSDSACKRDVGGIAEELRVMHGKTKVWSSDDCGKSQGKQHDVRTFEPNVEIYADLKWDSYDLTGTSCKKSSSPADTGKYSLVGRVGTKSATTTFSIVD